jgi:phosphoribosyl-dephospho-CoA transferase
MKSVIYFTQHKAPTQFLSSFSSQGVQFTFNIENAVKYDEGDEDVIDVVLDTLYEQIKHKDFSVDFEECFK